MDLQCPAVIVCLTPGDVVPTEAGGSRVEVGYLYEVGECEVRADLPLRSAPGGTFWEALAEIADDHRGEGVALIAPDALLTRVGAAGATFSVDSSGPTRI